MNHLYAYSNVIKPLAAIVITIIVLFGCGGSTGLTAEMSGQWKKEKDNQMVDIQISKEATAITLGGRVYNGTIEKIDEMSDTVYLNVKADDGVEQTWSIHQSWNLNGSAFTLKLQHNGVTETLIPKEQS